MKTKSKFFILLVILLAVASVLNIAYIFIYKPRFEDIAPKFLKLGIKGNNPKVSWEDIDFINYEKTRIGPGEHGVAVILTDPKEIQINDEWVKKEGYYVGVGNNISFTRALPDFRPEV